MVFSNSLSLALGLIIFSFAVTAALVVPFVNLLYKLKITRRKEGIGGKKASLFDKLHDIKAGTPTGGGILLILVVSTLFAIVFSSILKAGVFIQSAHDLGVELFVIFFTFVLFGALGLADDLIKIFGKPREGNLGMWIGMRRRTKFALQWIVAGLVGLVLYKTLGIHILHIPIINAVWDLGIFYIPFAAFTIVFFVNAFNFTDGLDGLASGLLVFFLIAFGIIAAGNLDTPLSVFISLWVGSLMAFLYFNVYPARVFLGDAGALAFGAMIAVIGLLTGSVASLFVIGGVFVIEAASSVIQILGWKVLKRPIFPLAPIHHAFLTIGWEEPKIVMRAWLAGIMLAIFGLWLAAL